ncbi:MULTISPECIES: hypothetical protein [unclassified Streptomyces]|uniref:hypothetical protein n=1 Tax=unclassified Streptomyces TaxID=2593676 RepID=UPI003D730657
MSNDQTVGTAGENADLETKNVHITDAEAESAIAEKIGIKNVHITTEPAKADTGTAAPLGNVHITSEPAN